MTDTADGEHNVATLQRGAIGPPARSLTPSSRRRPVETHATDPPSLCRRRRISVASPRHVLPLPPPIDASVHLLTQKQPAVRETEARPKHPSSDMHPLPPTPQSSASPALSATHNAGPESTSTVQHLLDFSAPGKYWSQGPATRRGSSTSTPDASNLLTSASVASRPASKKRQRSQDASSSSNQAVTHRFFGGKQDGKKAAGISSPSMPKKGSVGSSPRRPAEPLSPLGPAAIFKAKMSTVGGNLAAGRSSYAGCIIILRYKNADCCSCGIYFHYTREADKLAAMHAHASTHLGADLWLVEANYGPRMRQDMEYLRTEYPDAAVMTFTKWDIPTTYHGVSHISVLLRCWS